MGHINPRANQEGIVREVAGASGIPIIVVPEQNDSTPAPSIVVPAPAAPAIVAPTHVAPAVVPAPAPVTKPTHTITTTNLVVSMGGSAAGKTATFKKRMGGRNVQTVTVQVSPGGNTQRLKTHAVWVDANGVEHIHHNHQLRKVSDLNLNVVRRETVSRG